MFRSTRLLWAASVTLLTCAGAVEAQSVWVGTWAAAPMAATNLAGEFAQDRTLREIVHVSVGGARLRLVLSNEFGMTPLMLGGAQVALSTGRGSIQATRSMVVTFSGRLDVAIPPGALVVSDPVALNLPPLSDLAVSLYVPGQRLGTVTVHGFANATAYEAGGNQIAASQLTGAREMQSWLFLKGVDVESAANKRSTGAIVALGDSITDGARSTPDANLRWPDVLARRLQDNPATAGLGVLNEGIGGNRILHDGAGPDALARFDRDVLAQAGVRYVIVLEGINDIGHATDPRAPIDVVSAQDLIAGLSQLATRAHLRDLKILGATLTPFVGAGYQSAAGEQIRRTLNQWIRTTRELDGVIDFDRVTSDPAHPGMFLPQADSGDHLHPGDAGHRAMGESIDLNLFSR